MTTTLAVQNPVEFFCLPDVCLFRFNPDATIPVKYHSAERRLLHEGRDSGRTGEDRADVCGPKFGQAPATTRSAKHHPINGSWRVLSG